MLKSLSIGIACAVVICLTCAAAPAEDRGKVEGAVWQYEMSMVKRNAESRKGRFRINGTEIFQPRDMKPMKIGAILDKPREKPEKGDKVKVQFDALRGSDRKALNCKGQITFNSFGEVEGRLIDTDGVHWNFKASRVQE
jgi:hypothetical protein